MGRSPGYDEQTEQRRLRQTDDRPPSVAFLDDVFWATGGVLVFALPVLLTILSAGLRVQSTASLVFATLCLTAATLRGDWIDIGHDWPELGLKSLLGRALWYSTLIAVTTYGGAWLWTLAGPAVGLSVTTVGVVLGTVAVPVATTRLQKE